MGAKMNSTKINFQRSWRPTLRTVFPPDDALAVQMFRLWVFREDVKAMLGFMTGVKPNKRVGVTVWAQRSVLFRHIAVAVYEGLSLLVPSPMDKDGVKDAAVILAFIEEAKAQRAAFKTEAARAEGQMKVLEKERKRMYDMRNKFGGAHLDIGAVEKVLKDHDDYEGMMSLARSVADTRYDSPSEVMFLACLERTPQTKGELDAEFKKFINGFKAAHDAILLAVNPLMWLYAAKRGLLPDVAWKTGGRKR
jgi:hypothetical protein